MHQQLGLTLKQQGNLEGAIEAFETVLSLNSEHQEAYYNLGTVLRQYAASIRRGRVAPRPDASVEAGLKEATALLSRSDRAGSRKLLELLAKDSPASPDVWNLLGFVQGQERDLVAAISSLKRAVELSPDMPEARYNLGVAFWYSGQRASAIDSLEQSIRLNPAAAEVYAFLGMARRETGDLDRARSLASASHRA